MKINIDTISNEELEERIDSKLQDIKNNEEFYKHLLSLGFNDTIIRDNIAAVIDYFSDYEYNKKVEYSVEDSGDHYIRVPKIRDGKMYLEYDLCDRYKKIYKVKNLSKICDIPNEILAKHLTDIDKHSNRKDYMVELISMLKKYEPKFLFVKAKKNSGCGFMTGIFYKEILSKYNISGNFLAGPKRLTELSNMLFDNRAKAQFEEAINELSSCDVLVINKISNFNFNEYTRNNILFPILERRVSSNLTTIFTSELDYEDFMSLLNMKKANDVRFKQIKELLDDFKKFNISINFKLY